MRRKRARSKSLKPQGGACGTNKRQCPLAASQLKSQIEPTDQRALTDGSNGGAYRTNKTDARCREYLSTEELDN
jgi:hypothetical protein